MLAFYTFLILTILKRTRAGRDMFFSGLVVVLVVLSAALVLSAIVVLIVVLVRSVFLLLELYSKQFRNLKYSVFNSCKQTQEETNENSRCVRALRRNHLLPLRPVHCSVSAHEVDISSLFDFSSRVA